MFSYIKKPAVYLGGTVLLILGILYFSTLSPNIVREEIVVVTQKDLTEEVFITGTVKAGQFASLSFDRGGKLLSLPTPIGVAVKTATILARLESGTEEANLAEARSTIASAKVLLEKIKRGTRQEELRVKESLLEKEQLTLKNLREKTSLVIANGYNQAEVALNRLLDPLFSNDGSTNPRLTFSNGNQSGVYQAETERIVAGNSLHELQKFISSESDQSDSDLWESLRHLQSIQSLFLTLGEVLTTANGLNDALLADYKERVGTARANITSSLTSIQNHQHALRETESAITQAERELELAKAGSAQEDIREAGETVRQAEAKLASVQASFEKTLIRAPFTGRVASRNVEVGETISAGETVAEFIGSGVFIIEAQVPEADIAKISIGDTATATLDAYGDEVFFGAQVAQIESAEKEIEGVPTYKTTFAFDQGDVRLRSGLTANITVTKILGKNALTIPAKAVISEDGVSYVQKRMPDGHIEKVKVSIGIRTNSREVEITEGLSLGDKVLIQKLR